jgi:hypothetical protein
MPRSRNAYYLRVSRAVQTKPESPQALLSTGTSLNSTAEEDLASQETARPQSSPSHESVLPGVSADATALTDIITLQQIADSFSVFSDCDILHSRAFDPMLLLGDRNGSSSSSSEMGNSILNLAQGEAQSELAIFPMAYVSALAARTAAVVRRPGAMVRIAEHITTYHSHTWNNYKDTLFL